jgi:hypothetical protein
MQIRERTRTNYAPGERVIREIIYYPDSRARFNRFKDRFPSSRIIIKINARNRRNAESPLSPRTWRIHLFIGRD